MRRHPFSLSLRGILSVPVCTAVTKSSTGAAAEKVSDRFVGRMIRLAYLSPTVLETLVITRKPPAISINELMTVAELPWSEQANRAFE